MGADRIDRGGVGLNKCCSPDYQQMGGVVQRIRQLGSKYGSSICVRVVMNRKDSR